MLIQPQTVEFSCFLLSIELNLLSIQHHINRNRYFSVILLVSPPEFSLSTVFWLAVRVSPSPAIHFAANFHEISSTSHIQFYPCRNSSSKDHVSESSTNENPADGDDDDNGSAFSFISGGQEEETEPGNTSESTPAFGSVAGKGQEEQGHSTSSGTPQQEEQSSQQHQQHSTEEVQPTSPVRSVRLQPAPNIQTDRHSKKLTHSIS